MMGSAKVVNLTRIQANDEHWKGLWKDLSGVLQVAQRSASPVAGSNVTLW